MAQAGINLELKVGTGAEILTDYRARKHEFIMEAWGPDYPDPNTNADTFARNPDNSDEGNNTGILAWRNAWPATETNDADQRRGARAGRRQARGDVPGDPAHPPEGLALRADVPADRAGGDALERRGLLRRRLDQLGRLLRDDEELSGPARAADGAPGGHHRAGPPRAGGPPRPRPRRLPR